MNKEKWIEEILQTAKEIKPVAANPFMATRIEAKLQQPAAVNKLPLQWVYASASVLVLLVVLNITIWRGNTSSAKERSGVQHLMQDYGWNDNEQLYSLSSLNKQHE
jgi:hypothetical protein